MESGYDDHQMITIGGFVFVCRVTGAWLDGKWVPASELTPEMNLALASHHADTLKARYDHIGSDEPKPKEA